MPNFEEIPIPFMFMTDIPTRMADKYRNSIGALLEDLQGATIDFVLNSFYVLFHIFLIVLQSKQSMLISFSVRVLDINFPFV